MRDLGIKLKALQPKKVKGASLTDADAREIIMAFRRGVCWSEIARALGCSRQNITVLLGTWAANHARIDE